jgi:hypothetical protein
MNCKNCDQIVDGNFCTHCGQSTKVAKINFTNFLGEFSDSVFQVNKGLLYSMKALFVRPGDSIREYLTGKRKNHFKPIAYAFTLSTIYFLVTKFTGSNTFINDVIAGWSSYPGTIEKASKPLVILNWFAENYAYTVLILLPLYALASYLAFLKTGFNYLEHFVLNAYIIGQQAIFYALTSILNFVIGYNETLTLVTLLLSIFYAFIVFWQFFSKQNRVVIILRSILTYILYFVIISIVTFIILFIYQ